MSIKHVSAFNSKRMSRRWQTLLTKQSRPYKTFLNRKKTCSVKKTIISQSSGHRWITNVRSMPTLLLVFVSN